MSNVGPDSSYIAGSYCSFKQILNLAVPAVLLNAAAPATASIQTILLGRLEHNGRDQLAAFSAVCVVANFTTFLLNFMVRWTGAMWMTSVSSCLKCCVAQLHTAVTHTSCRGFVTSI